MKALTICQPYAHLIAFGHKLVENREWPTRYRGDLLIHAGKSRDWMAGTDEQFARDYGERPVFGAVVAMASLVDCLHIDRIIDGQYDTLYPWLREHEHAHGTWCWVLENVERLTDPLPWRGAQGLFDIPWPP